MSKLFNLARMTTATTGTGSPLTLGSAVAGFLTFAQAGVANSDVVVYGIRDGANSEVGTGSYTSAGTTLTRSVIKSTNSDSTINLSGSAQVFITALKEQIGNLTENNTWTGVNTFTDATDATSDTLAAVVLSGGLAVEKTINNAQVASTRANFDIHNASTIGDTSALVSNFAINPASSGSYYLFVVSEVAVNGQGAIYLMSNNTVTKIGGQAAWENPTTTPSSGAYSVQFDGGSQARIYNNNSTNSLFKVLAFRYH